MDPTRATSAARFLPLAAAAAAEFGPGPLHHVRETESTNTELAREARRGRTAPVTLVADHQRAGRGRRDRRWADDSGEALLVSFRLPCEPSEAVMFVQSLGAAARAATDSLCVAEVRAKWPNDLVVVDGEAPGKLAGVLAEFVASTPPCVVVGLGVNIAPLVGMTGATSVVESGGPEDRDLVLAALLREFRVRRENSDGVIAELRAHSATIGSRVRVELPGGDELTGRAVDLEIDGRLVVEGDTGRRHVIDAGDVIHLRPG
jgi:BirA family transcriptional regulator, biotin operon repressor / biotin---[acetyl-CoA-carboxylase] ligase